MRHHLGQTLLQSEKYAEAEKIYREDLNTWKENGWALMGLHQALQKQGKAAEAKRLKSRFEKHGNMQISTLLRPIACSNLNK